LAAAPGPAAGEGPDPAGPVPAPAGETLAIVKLAESTQAPTADGTLASYARRRRLLGAPGRQPGAGGYAAGREPAAGRGRAPAAGGYARRRLAAGAAPASAPAAALPPVYILFRFDFSGPGAHWDGGMGPHSSVSLLPHAPAPRPPWSFFVKSSHEVLRGSV